MRALLLQQRITHTHTRTNNALTTNGAQGEGLESPSDAKIRDATGKFYEILKDLDTAYVDVVDIDKLSETAFQSMLTSLDPYTEFENVKVADEMKVMTFGNYGGVGLVITKPRGDDGKELPYVKVVDAFEGYAFKQGMRPGDKLLKVQGKDVRDLTVSQVSELLKGPADSSVDIEYERPGVPQPQQIALQRKVVVIRDVPLAITVGQGDQKVGYAKLRGFSSSSSAELFYVLNQFQNQEDPAKAVILDLRGNGGGLLNSAIKVSDLFLSEGQKVVSTRGRILDSPTQTEKVDEKTNVKTFETVFTAEPSVYYTPPLVKPEMRVAVLIDKGTASAAEIVAGAIQDHDRGVVMGETSYGKGLVQQLQRLGKGGTQIKFTVGKYYTPSGRCIQSKTYKEGDRPGTGTVASKILDENRKVFYTDKGRVVKDAGGIEPDVRLPAPESKQLTRELYRRDAFYKYADKWQARHAADGEKLATAAGKTLVSDAEYAEFKAFVQEAVKKDAKGLETPYDRKLDELEKSLKEQGFKEGIAEVESLKTRLDTLLLSEFEADKEKISQILAQTIRAHYLPDSAILQQALESDPQVNAALQLLRDPVKYASSLDTRGAGNTATASTAKVQPPSQASN